MLRLWVRADGRSAVHPSAHPSTTPKPRAPLMPAASPCCTSVSMCCAPWPNSWKSVSTYFMSFVVLCSSFVCWFLVGCVGVETLIRGQAPSGGCTWSPLCVCARARHASARLRPPRCPFLHPYTHTHCNTYLPERHERGRVPHGRGAVFRWLFSHVHGCGHVG